MEVSKNYGHQHPLVLLNEEQLMSNPSGTILADEQSKWTTSLTTPLQDMPRNTKDMISLLLIVSAPCFGCAEDCGFYVHKIYAEAPSELNHPFHQQHPLVLLQNPPSTYTWYACYFCGQRCEKFVYHCSPCNLGFHIKCAWFTFNIAQNNLKELEHVPLEPPMISTNKDDEQLENVPECFACWEPLANYTYFSPHCGFNLHQKCAELPLRLNHICHRKHPLLLQFNSDGLSCKICQETPGRGFPYVCSSRKFVVHFECLSLHLAPVIKDERHEHPFSLFPRRAPFVCDACGTEGTYSAYICCECNIIVHKKCTSLPSIIKSKWHDHAIFHNYFLPDDFGSSDCIICHDAVSPEHGSCCCSYCSITFHVRCVTEEASSYYILSREEAYKISDESSVTCVLERNDAGQTTYIQHFKHTHNLQLSAYVGGYENNCDGCMLPISNPFYCCSQCQFFIHNACAELPKKKHEWHYKCRQQLQDVSHFTSHVYY
ncbi:uncharacterized protein LOC120218542 [Hibiscus syriacus]|uniref:uncharacterized protein LOC120218542 n=1 Tax=Hibiscus syriacus TaxID=106335 RepID=UPI001920B001|nr:uncharacterized protein LOC120218542 [Hibiscus syriacus]